MDERDRLIAEIAAWEEQRNEARSRINWTFTTERARTKLARAYPEPAKSHEHSEEVLAPRPHGRALLGEGKRSLAGVFRGPHRVIDRRLAAAHGDEGIGDRTALAHVNGGLDGARRQGRFPGDGRGELAGGAHQRAERGEPIDEAERKRFLCFDPPAGQHELHRYGARQPPRQPLDAARIRNDAEADLGQRECGALGRDDQIAGKRKLKSAAEGEAIDCRNDRLVEFEKLRQAGEAARAVIGACRLPFRRGLEIPSGAKKPIAGSGQDGDASLGIVVKRSECKVKRTAGRRVDRISLGPVERHLDDCAAPEYANGRCHSKNLLAEADQCVDSDGA